MTLLKNIHSLPLPKGRPLIIALSGFGGSGKTTLAGKLKNVLQDAEMVCIDSFSNHEWRRNADWDNFDRKRFTEEILKPARANNFPLSYAHVPWPGQIADPAVKVPEVKYLIVEGCSIFHPELLQYYDYKIWVDCPLDEATKRAMWRDRYVHKDEQDYYWLNIWMPNDRDFFEKYRPDKVADIVVNTSESHTLTGGSGNLITKVGKNVHRPAGSWTPMTQELLGHIRTQGFLLASVPRGFDDDGNEIVSYIPGEAGCYPMTENVRSDEAIVSAAKVLRAYHDATVDLASTYLKGWQLPAHQPVEVICHNDFGPHNCIYDGKEVVGVIDFDYAHPGPRIWDVAYAVYRFAELTTGEPENIDERVRKVRLFCDAYGLEDRTKLIDTILERLTTLVDFMQQKADEGDVNFQAHIARGDVDLYVRDIAYIKQYRDIFERGLHKN